MNNLINIFQKELMDIVRDRKGMRQTLLIPLILGIFYAVFNPLLGTLADSDRESTLLLPAQGIEYAGDDFIATFEAFNIELVPFEGDMEAAIRSAEEPAGLIFTEGFADNVANAEDATLIVRTNGTAGGLFGGGISLGRLQIALNAYNEQLTVQRLTEAGVDVSVLTPVTLDTADLATPAQRAGITAALFLPILIATSIVTGGQFVAIDVTAGEKERGTLESLLVTPATAIEIFVGKMLVVFLISAVPLATTLLGYWATTLVLPESMTDGVGALPFPVILQTIVITLPLVLLASVISMLISIRTRDFKSAQSSLNPLVFGMIFISMAGAIVPPATNLLYLLPIYGTAGVISTLVLGGVVPVAGIVLSMVGCLIGTAVGISVALPLFNRERLLYTV